MHKHRHQEFIRFLNAIEHDVPTGKLIHAVLDNYATQKHPKVRAWLERHPRWVFHFTPTSASWLNAVEGFFSTLTRRRLKRGVFRGVVDLQAAINRYLEEHNANPKPFVWTKPAAKIFDKLARLSAPSGGAAIGSWSVLAREIAAGRLSQFTLCFHNERKNNIRAFGPADAGLIVECRTRWAG